MSASYLDGLFGASGRVALITGGATGLGFFMAEAWVKTGGKGELYIAGRREDKLKAAAAELNKIAKNSALYFVADVSKKTDITALAEHVAARESALDVLVNNAGMCSLEQATYPGQTPAEMGAGLASADPELWAAHMLLNTWAPAALTGSLVPLLAEAAKRTTGSGSVLNISSTSASVWNPFWPIHVSKASLLHLTKIQAAKLASHGIRVNSIQPGSFTTDMNPDTPLSPSHVDNVDKIPLKHGGSPEDIAGTFLYLSGRAGAYTTGTNFAVDGGALLVLNNANGPY
ncbi:NAD(P)-binding protein [Dentipellis sp. KUC8613]|nr:NAD(P)-binding protein [Dentipellis sp. KUC8613]